jgi:hypothetical protein
LQPCSRGVEAHPLRAKSAIIQAAFAEFGTRAVLSQPRNGERKGLPIRELDAAPRRKLGAVPPRRSAAGPRGEVPGGT